MGESRKRLGNVLKKLNGFGDNDNKSGDGYEYDEKGQNLGKLVGRYCNERRLITGNGREGRRLAFDGKWTHGGVWRDDRFLNRGRSIEKREGWRSGKGWNEMGGHDAEGSESKDPVGESLQDISEVKKPRGEVEDDVEHCDL